MTSLIEALEGPNLPGGKPLNCLLKGGPATACLASILVCSVSSRHRQVMSKSRPYSKEGPPEVLCLPTCAELSLPW